jgi:hypothetical protein
MAIQTEYRERIQAARPGLVQGSDYDSKTGTCEVEAGIGFGLAVGQGAGDKGVVLGGALGGFRGISIRDVTQYDAAGSGAIVDKYPQYANMAYLTRGLVYVVPAVAVAPGDPVHYNATTGVLTNTGGNGPVKGARWASSADADGYALVDLGGYNQD